MRKWLRSPWSIGIIVVLVIIALAILGYWFQWDWTGLPEHIGPKVPQDQQYQSAKTAWDWLSVLAVPVVVGFGVAWFTTKQSAVSDAENKDNQREAALQAYIDKISELLLVNDLQTSLDDNKVRKIARVRTLTVLRGLDDERKGSVLQFLQEADLIDKGKPIIDLRGARLDSANLNSDDLSDANLSEVNLSDAHLFHANLSYTNLVAASLLYAELIDADLSGAELIDADLRYADLSGADLDGADLSGVNLNHARNVTNEQLSKAKSLQEATMPNGTIHP